MIKETTKKDLNHIMMMWNDGEVMQYVGFPDGLHMTEESMEKWFENINLRPNCKHYSIYDREDGYCGEAFYSFVSKEQPATLDIKLVKNARGKQIARLALSHTIDQLFLNTKAMKAYVDPNIDNHRAISLYQKLGFTEIRKTIYEQTVHIYMEICKSTWQDLRKNLVKLEPITYDNFIEACFLQLKEEQKKFIATNAFSLAQSKYQEECIPKAIYVGNNMVGFIMYCLDRTDHEYWIYRLMIDNRYQGLGYGKKAMDILLNELMMIATNKLIRISFEPENSVAKALYEKLGFVSTGIIDKGEIIYEKKW